MGDSKISDTRISSGLEERATGRRLSDVEEVGGPATKRLKGSLLSDVDNIASILARRNEGSSKDVPPGKAILNDIDEITREISGLNPCSSLLCSLLAKRGALHAQNGDYELALVDVNCSLALNPKAMKPWQVKGSVHFIRKEYVKARDSFLKGLDLEPEDCEMKSSLALCLNNIGMESIDSGKSLSSNDVNEDRKTIVNHAVMNCADVLDCPLCLKLLYQPSILPCGHTFCTLCLERTLDYDLRCPLCREHCYVRNEETKLTPNIALQALLSKQYGKQTVARGEEVKGDIMEGSEGLPLFVLDAYVPPKGVSFPMVIFEPRYKLFIRRCMKLYNGKFGLVYSGDEEGGDVDKGLSRAGVVLTITNKVILDDGRYLINTKSGMRFQIEGVWTKDDYKMGKVTELEDEPIEGYPLAADVKIDPREDVPKSPAMEATYYERFLRSMTMRFEAMVKSSNGAIKESVWDRYGRMPSEEEGIEKFSLWFAALLTISPAEKQKLLAQVNTVERLRALYMAVKTTPRSCALM